MLEHTSILERSLTNLATVVESSYMGIEQCSQVFENVASDIKTISNINIVNDSTESINIS